ncbi:DUF4232 domain-containing protein [Cryptosporangium minutisporangium]|uniref:DUF4232 domain-containing protein n=1 Tax=Cryptosporangium minutisporangium TaxID=113569 RepID=A0ABP6T335_9ACTN
MRARVLLLTLLLLAACGTGSAPPDVLRPAADDAAPRAASPSPSATGSLGPTCLEPGVEVTVGEVSAAMGLRAVGLTLRNCGTDPYTVQGYPVIEVLDADRRTLPAKVLHGTEHVHRLESFAGPPERIVVAPGESVGASLLWRNLTTVGETVVNGAYLRVAPAAGQATHTLTFSVDLGNTGRLAVSHWIRR